MARLKSYIKALIGFILLGLFAVTYITSDEVMYVSIDEQGNPTAAARDQLASLRYSLSGKSNGQRIRLYARDPGSVAIAEYLQEINLSASHFVIDDGDPPSNMEANSLPEPEGHATWQPVVIEYPSIGHFLMEIIW
ncbi:MAG: hypothetical protein Alpg2KO_03130 [Alphaproteobacteria bacterium]